MSVTQTALLDGHEQAHQSSVRTALVNALEEKRAHFMTHLPQGEIGISWDPVFDGKPLKNVSIHDDASIWKVVDAQCHAGHDAFISTASFALPFGTMPHGGGKPSGRTTNNVASIGALVGDVDVSPSKSTGGVNFFNHRDEGLEALEKISATTGLPKPSMTIKSGTGAHVWWRLAFALQPSEGKSLREEFCAAITGLEPRLTVDPSRWKDINGLLRPIGTLNYKARKGDHKKGILPVPAHPGDPVEMLAWHDNDWSPDDVSNWVTSVKPRGYVQGATVPNPTLPVASVSASVSSKLVIAPAEPKAVLSALIALGKAGRANAYADWQPIIQALAGAAKNAELESALARKLATAFSRASSRYHAMHAEPAIDKIFANSDGRCAIGSLFHEAKLLGWVMPQTALPLLAQLLPSTASNLPFADRGQPASFVASRAAPTNALAGGLLVPGTFTLLAGAGGRGKSLLALHVAVSLATNNDLLQLGDIEALTVAAIFAEETIGELGKRVRALQIEHGIIAPTNLTLWSKENTGGFALLKPGPGGVPVLDEQGVVGIDTIAARHRVVIIDNLAIVTGGQTNDLRAAAQTAGALNTIAGQHGAAILALAHERKDKPGGDDGHDIDAVSGAKTWTDLARGGKRLVGFSKGKSSALLPIAEEDQDRFIQLVSSKVNYTDRNAPWFEIVTHTIPGLFKRDSSPEFGPALRRWYPAAAAIAGGMNPAKLIALQAVQDACAVNDPLSSATPKQAKNAPCAIVEVARKLAAQNPGKRIGELEAMARAALHALENDGTIMKQSVKVKRPGSSNTTVRTAWVPKP